MTAEEITMETNKTNTIKPIFYSKKRNMYYFVSEDAISDEKRIVRVYGGENLKGGEVKTSKTGKKYILGYVKEALSKDGHIYFKVTTYYEPTK